VFLFTFHSNYGDILYRLRDIATYFLENREFFVPHLYLALRRGWPRQNFVKVFDAGKTRMIELPYGKKQWRHVKPFSSDTGTLTDRRTDGQTDLLYQYRASVCWRALKTTVANWK